MEIPKHQVELAQGVVRGQAARIGGARLQIPDLPAHELTIWVLGWIMGFSGQYTPRMISFAVAEDDFTLLDLLEARRGGNAG